jgi:MFS family permease
LGCFRPTPRSDLAPIALVVLRCQGFAVGGEWGGAVLLAAEHGDAARRGFWASWPQAECGRHLLAAGVLALLAAVQSEEDFLAWGWRIPFLISRSSSRSAGGFGPMFRRARRSSARSTEAETPPKVPALECSGAARCLDQGIGLRVGENISY